MTSKFNELYESYSKRYELGGFLVGDFVVFRPDYKNNESYKAMNSVMKTHVDQVVDSGVPLRVSGLGNKYGTNTNLERYIKPDDAVVTVSVDEGGGRWLGKISVGAGMLDIATNTRFCGVGDENKKPLKKGETWTHGEYEVDEDHITRQTDKGNGKNSKTNIKLEHTSDLNDIVTNLLNEKV
jgi:hypothetical protein